MIYFAYGSNMDVDQMTNRCPGSKLIGTGRLYNYSMVFTRWSRAWNSATADILPDQKMSVYGVLFEVTLEDLKKMDRFADYPNSYVRQDITVETGELQLPAMTYVAIRQGPFLPSKAYVGKMILGAEQHQLPEEYISFLKSLKTHD